MPRIRVCALALLLLFLTHSVFAQHPSGNTVDVAYVLTGSGELGFRLQTYDVDSHTGYPTPEGQALRLLPGSTSENLVSAFLTAAPDDHFLYIAGETDSNEQFIWVYPTDSFGVPQDSPIQIANTTGTYDFQIDPNGKLAYVIEWGAPINIRVFDVDPDTGLLSKTSRVVQSWSGYGPCGDGEWTEGFPVLDGFNRKGNELYEDWFCDYFDTNGGFDYSSAIDPGTGQLGQPKEIFNWVGDGEDGDDIFFTARFMIDFYTGDGSSVVNVYPLRGASKPLISCTVMMLQACGDARNLYNDPAGEYLFLQLPTNMVQIAKIERATKTIVDTGNSLAQPVVTMSPDRRLIYTRAPGQREPYNAPNTLWIYVFDPQTGAVQQGGELSVGGDYYQLVPAVRESN